MLLKQLMEFDLVGAGVDSLQARAEEIMTIVNLAQKR